MNTCDTCMWWGNETEKENPGIHPFRQCMNVELGADNNFKAGEEVRGYLQSGPKFSCIHHEPK